VSVAGTDERDAFTGEARMERLPELMAFVDEACARGGAGEEDAFAVRLAVEEAFTNVVKHGYPDGPGPVSVELHAEDGALVVTLADRGRPFDPAAAPRPELDAGWEARAVGGLGWHLIRQMMSEVKHRPREGGGNVVTLVRRPDGPATEPSKDE
jgi:serine/threonine-protein kinase RsbW